MYTDMKAESVRETRQIAAWLHIKTSWLTDCPSHQPDSGSESGTDSSPGSRDPWKPQYPHWRPNPMDLRVPKSQAVISWVSTENVGLT